MTREYTEIGHLLNDLKSSSQYYVLEEDNFVSPNYTKATIRKWGCNITDTPLIFVHIGKAGGGNIRARFSASALNYNPLQTWKKNSNSDSFYPVSKNKKAKFCNSGHKNYRTHTNQTFEGTRLCYGMTPLGLITCPELNAPLCHKSICDKFHDDECLTVYVGHNCLGSEMHWLPFQVLNKWWVKNGWDVENEIEGEIGHLNHPTLYDNLLLYSRQNDTVCKDFRGLVGEKRKEYFNESVVDRCFFPATKVFDEKANELISPNEYSENGYSSFYHTLPVVRTTVLREPFSWLVSKFFWHNIKDYDCLDLDNVEWINMFALTYIHKLCGEDCEISTELGYTDLDRFEKQAASNLRNAFAVVGLLSDQEGFYDMVSKRVKYVDMSLNPKVHGSTHSTKNFVDKIRCDEKFQEKEFQRKLINASPELAALVRLYDIGVEVNKFHKEELETCS